ncbi:MAG: hypothetical protein QFX12_07365 [Rickettsia africae]
MKLSYIHGFGNKGNIFEAKGISAESLSHQANLNVTPKYLTPDYFLPSSSNAHYYRKKHKGNLNLNFKSKFRKISRVASVMLLSLGFIATTLEVKAQPVIEANQSFLFGKGSAGISTNVPLPPIMPQSLPPAPPIPPVLPAMPDFISGANIAGKADNRSALFESIRNFGKNILKKVKREPKPKVISSDGEDLMSQLHNTLERRRNGIAGEKNGAKPKKVVKQLPKLTSEEQARKKAEIARERRRAEVEAVKARIEQKAKERGENREGVVNGIDPALHHNIVSDLRSEIALLREQLKNQGINNLAGTLGGGAEEPIYSKPIDTISMASSVTEYSEPWQDPDTEIGEAFETEFSMQKQIEPTAPPLSVLSSLEDLHISEDASLSEEERVMKMLDEAIEDSGYSGSSCGGVDDWSGEDSIADTDGYDTVCTSSGSEYSEDSSDEDGIPFSPPATEEKKAELDIIREFQVSEQSSAVASNASINEANIAADSNESEEASQEESTTASVFEILDEVDEKDSVSKDISTNLGSTASTEPQEQATSMSQEELRKKAEATSVMQNQARKMSKISSKQIRDRIFARDIVTAAVASGDDDADDASEKTIGYRICRV